MSSRTRSIDLRRLFRCSDPNRPQCIYYLLRDVLLSSYDLLVGLTLSCCGCQIPRISHSNTRSSKHVSAPVLLTPDGICRRLPLPIRCHCPTRLDDASITDFTIVSVSYGTAAQRPALRTHVTGRRPRVVLIRWSFFRHRPCHLDVHDTARPPTCCPPVRPGGVGSPWTTHESQWIARGRRFIRLAARPAPSGQPHVTSTSGSLVEPSPDRPSRAEQSPRSRGASAAGWGGAAESTTWEGAG